LNHELIDWRLRHVKAGEEDPEGKIRGADSWWILGLRPDDPHDVYVVIHIAFATTPEGVARWLLELIQTGEQRAAGLNVS